MFIATSIRSQHLYGLTANRHFITITMINATNLFLLLLALVGATVVASESWLDDYNQLIADHKEQSSFETLTPEEAQKLVLRLAATASSYPQEGKLIKKLNDLLQIDEAHCERATFADYVNLLSDFKWTLNLAPLLRHYKEKQEDVCKDVLYRSLDEPTRQANTNEVDAYNLDLMMDALAATKVNLLVQEDPQYPVPKDALVQLVKKFVNPIVSDRLNREKKSSAKEKFFKEALQESLMKACKPVIKSFESSVNIYEHLDTNALQIPNGRLRWIKRAKICKQIVADEKKLTEQAFKEYKKDNEQSEDCSQSSKSSCVMKFFKRSNKD